MLSIKIPWLRNEVHWIVFKTILRGTFVCVRPVLLVIFAVVASVKRDQFAATGVPGCTNETNHRPCYDGTIFKTSALPLMSMALFAYCVFWLYREYMVGLAREIESGRGREVTRHSRIPASSNVNDTKTTEKTLTNDQNVEILKVKLTGKREEAMRRLYFVQVLILSVVEEFACYCIIRCLGHSRVKANIPEAVCKDGCYEDPFLNEAKPMFFHSLFVYGTILVISGMLEVGYYWFQSPRRTKAKLTNTNQSISEAENIV